MIKSPFVTQYGLKQEYISVKTTALTKQAWHLAMTFFALLFGVSTAVAQLPPPLISLGFNENSGLSVANAGSVSATFSKTTPPLWSTNVPANGGTSCVDFGTATGNYYVESGAVIGELANLASFTVTGWVNNRNSSIGSGGNRIVSWINNGGNGVDIVYASGGTLKVGINQWPDSSTAISSTGMIPTDAAASASNWRFFAVTYDSSAGTIQLYFGGNLTPASLDQSLTYNRGLVGATIGKLAIGHFNAESSRTSRTDRMFRGLIDQVQIFGSVLSLSEIQTAQSMAGIAGPVFTNAALAGGDMVMQGTNGPAKGGYQMLYSDDVNQPVGNWANAGFGAFDAQGHFSFTHPAVLAEPAGFYRLQIISYEGLPEITSQPQNQVVDSGGIASFSVTATGLAPLNYQWFYNTNTVLVGKTNSTLTLSNTQLTNTGKYSVTVANLLGSTNSLFATLAVSSLQLIGWASVAGYGQTTTTGGGNGTPILATNIAHLKSLASDSTPRVIQLSGTYVTGNSPVSISNNKTLVGLGNDAVIQGGIDINTRSNIIVRNLSILGNGQFSNTNSDGTEIQPVDSAAVRTSHHLWFDHLNISDGPDGNLDLTIGSDLITVSWCKFWYTTPTRAHRLSCLIGNGSTATTDTNKNNVTYHHNWFAQSVQERMPRLLFGKGHVFNNYYSATNNNYCVGVGTLASALIENNYFSGVKDPHKFADTNPAYITANNNFYSGTTGKQETGLGNPTGTAIDPLPFTNPPYNYTLDAAVNVPAIVTLGAGPQ